jgi:hypothetical protein
VKVNARLSVLRGPSPSSVASTWEALWVIRRVGTWFLVECSIFVSARGKRIRRLRSFQHHKHQKHKSPIFSRLHILTTESPKSLLYSQSRTGRGTLRVHPSPPMPTQPQIEANRRNGQDSTSPTCLTGKAVSSTNSLQPGRLAKPVVLPSGSHRLFRRLPAGVRLIHPFASQNLQPSPQPPVKQGLISTQEMLPRPGFCVTTPPAPEPASPEKPRPLTPQIGFVLQFTPAPGERPRGGNPSAQTTPPRTPLS